MKAALSGSAAAGAGAAAAAASADAPAVNGSGQSATGDAYASRFRPDAQPAADADSELSSGSGRVASPIGQARSRTVPETDGGGRPAGEEPSRSVDQPGRDARAGQ